MDLTEPTYLRNPWGRVAVSPDDGETIILPNGRKVANSAEWSPVYDDLRAELTPEQEEHVARWERADNSRREFNEAAEGFVEEFNASRRNR